MSNIIITGANQGIGYYIVQQFLKDGNRVAVLDLEISNIENLKNEYRGQLQVTVCDMRDTACVERCIAEIYKEFGTIDIAIHNACVCTFGCADETSEDIYKNVFDVNYFGALRLTKTKSAEPLPVPKEILASPEAVGTGLAKKIHSPQFIICHSFAQKLQVMCCYLFPIKMGKLMSGKLMELNRKNNN